MAKPYQSDYIDFDGGREGYVDVPRTPTYAPVTKTARRAGGQGHGFGIRTQERLGSVIAAAGTVWATYAATMDYADLWRFQILPPGPVELCGLGILLWLHAKWRRSTKVD